MIISEHSFDESLLPKAANILDLGCRGFEFTNYFKEKGHTVFSVDVDYIGGGNYYLVAISGEDGRCDVEYSSDGNATKIKNGNDVLKLSLKSFSEEIKIEKWDLIKMDIEGSEISVLEK